MGYEYSETIQEVAEDLIKEKDHLKWIGGSGFNIAYMASDKIKKHGGMRTYGECVMLPELYQTMTGYDFVIIIYTMNVDYMDEDQINTLVEHELLHVWKKDNGSPCIRQHDIGDFRKIVEAYGLNWADKKEG